jgi:hypothetical protein
MGAATLGFVACGGSSSLQRGTPSGDDDSDSGTGGTAGTRAKGGSAGRPAGRGGTTGAQGGSTVGVGGSTARGGSGGKGGKGGQSAKGGDAGAFGGESDPGGSSGTAGEAGASPVDPSCHCTTQGHAFSCTVSSVTVSGGFADPWSCALPDTAVKRELCGTGRRYTFLEGEENQYVVELDSTGNATYFSASGYVSPACGLDPQEFYYGNVSMGTPRDVACTDACSQCDSFESLPQCAACERAPSNDDLVREPLAAYCEHEYCPATIAEAREYLAVECGSVFGGTSMETGCGKVALSISYEPPERLEYTFDEQTGALESAYKEEERDPFGPCQAFAYQAGPRREACASETSCFYCRTGTGEAGAAGAASDLVCR